MKHLNSKNVLNRVNEAEAGALDLFKLKHFLKNYFLTSIRNNKNHKIIFQNID